MKVHAQVEERKKKNNVYNNRHEAITKSGMCNICTSMLNMATEMFNKIIFGIEIVQFMGFSFFFL